MGVVARGMWDLLGAGIGPVSPALKGRFLITGPALSLVFIVMPDNWKGHSKYGNGEINTATHQNRLSPF